MIAPPRQHSDIRQLTEASAWRVRLDELEVETTDEFEAWMARDPANGVAWDEVMAGWRHVGEQASSPELLALRRDALDRAHRLGRRRWTGPGARVAIAACFALVLMTGLFGAYSWWSSQPLIYATSAGERRVITLEDGSRVSLDTATEVRVHYNDDARRLHLVRGQARFDVARDVMRTFSVRARDRTVVATGTVFNIDLLGPKVLVTLIEGKVIVLQGAAERPIAALKTAARSAIALSEGQQLTIAPEAPPEVERVSLDRASAWETGTLVFEDEPLSSVAERVSRYAATPVTVSPGAAELKISGVFKTGDTATFVDVVTRYLPVTASTGPKGETVIAPAS